MSLLDECSFNNFEDINDISFNIDKDLEDIDNLINELDFNNALLVYNNIIHINYFFLLMFYALNNEDQSKKIVKYNRYGFDSGYNLFKLYLTIIDINVKYILNNILINHF